MDIKEKAEKVIREFKLTTLALKNRTSVFLLTAVVIGFGLYSYKLLPKELFPEVIFPYVMVQTTYPGNPPVDIENLVTRPIEKELESIKGIKEIRSTSAQGASMIFIEFNPNIDIKNALDDVNDAVDKAKRELPNDLLNDPMVMDIDFSEFPVININLSGDYSIDELKNYAEILEEEIEAIYEVSKVVVQGVNEKEIKIHVDPHKLVSFNMSFGDIESAVAFENMSVSGGEIKLGKTRMSLRTIGEFENLEEIRNMIVKQEGDKVVYLREVAEVYEDYEEATSYTRLDKQPVVSLQVVKKGGENLLSTIAQIEEILEKVRKNKVVPEDLRITTTNDQSDMVKKQLHNLENSMIMSIIFVVLVLFFFLGTRNALFVALAIPLSMFLSFMILGFLDYKINMIVLFGLILALGMLVDNAIVVVENIYRFVDQGHSKFDAAKKAVGEIAGPIIASTATTLAAFLPLAFWDSIIGEFMKYLPITLIIVLTSSLFVALVIIPVFSSTLIKGSGKGEKVNKRRAVIFSIVFIGLALIFYASGAIVMANLFIAGLIITLLNLLFLNRAGIWFKNVFLIKLENGYLRLLQFALRGKNSVIFLTGTILLMFITIGFFNVRKPKVIFFPDNDPNYINILAELPIGTDIDKTDSLMIEMEDHVFDLLEEDKDIVKSVVTNVGAGAILQDDISASGGVNRPNKGLITVSFVDFEDRKDINTSGIMKKLSENLIGKYPGVTITVEKDRMGPPTGKAINIEITGKEYDKLIRFTDTVKYIIENADIEGIGVLKMDLTTDKQELVITVDRDKARRFGLSTGQIAGTMRTALYGKEISDFKVGEDEYPIQLRLQDKYRYSIPSLMGQKIIFRNNEGKLLKVPIDAVADVEYSTTYGSVRRKDLKRVITLYSNVIEGFNANEINENIRNVLSRFDIPKEYEGYNYSFAGGEQQDMQESMDFLIRALMIAVALILLILVSQFNSVVKPFIIIFSVVLSTIGVFGGIATFRMDFVVAMTMIGIISLAGVVVNNAIVLIDYIELLKQRREKELELDEKESMTLEETTKCIVLGGKTRLRPVLLTAITTILGLLPMATGMNIDFAGLLSEYKPNIFFGGDMVKFWGPISWTVIFGLAFATFLTLIIVPVMYRIAFVVKLWLLRFNKYF